MKYGLITGIVLIINAILILAVSLKKKENKENRKILLTLSIITIVCGVVEIILNLI